jgi:hypothetical protein
MTSAGAITALGLFAGFMFWWRKHKASHALGHPDEMSQV